MMEVDMQHDRLSSASTHNGSNRVHFGAATAIASAEVDVNMRPKQKGVRRLNQLGAIDASGQGGGCGVDNVNGSSSAPKHPPSPSKLKKTAEKDRHSRTGRRGLPKKGGAGGKGTWGKLTDGFEEDGHTRDSRDPNYDSEEEEDTYIVSPSSPQLSAKEFAQRGESVFKEFFENTDPGEVQLSLEEMNIHNIKSEVVRVLVTVAMEEKAAHRELASQLISYLYGRIVNSRDISSGLDSVMKQLDDLCLDTPDAPDVLGNFIARCVADDTLPPVYVSNHKGLTGVHEINALKRAQLLLNMKHGLARLDNVWGIGGGQRPVMFLVNKMIVLLKEYLSSRDKQEAVRCLRELEVPHFHHEFVYQAVVLVVEDGREACASVMCELLQYMCTAMVVPQDQLMKGIHRVFEALTDIVLDAPNAYHTLGKFVEQCIGAGLFPADVQALVPQRGRKRFVSEGDGGAIKQPEN